MSGAGRHVSATGGERVWILNDLVRSLVKSGDTGARFMLSETITTPGGGPPPHVHHNEDEIFYILDGDFDFLINDKVVAAPVGSLVFGPRKVPHQFRCKGPGRGRFLVWVQPGGFEEFFADIAMPVVDPNSLPAIDPAMIERLMAACPRFGLEMLPEHRETGRLPAIAPPPMLNTLGSGVRILCDGRTSGGTLTVTETTAPPGLSPPPHLHRDHDEVFYILDGRFEILLGAVMVAAISGDTVFVPKGTIHTFKNVGTAPGRFLTYHTPAGLEHFVAACANLTKSGTADVANVTALMHEHGMELASAIRR